MASKGEVTAHGSEGFQVSFWHAGLRHVVPLLPTQEDAALICDLLAVKEAVDAGQELGVLVLRSRDGTGSINLPSATRAVLAGTPFGQLVHRLRSCVLEQRCPIVRSDVAVGRTLLHAAAFLGDTLLSQLLLMLLPAGAAAAADGAGRTTLLGAALGGSVEATSFLLEAAPQTAAASSVGGLTPMHAAAVAGHTAIVQLLLSAAPATAAGVAAAGVTPLHLAVQNGHTAVVQLLLSATPATAVAVNASGATPLHDAAQGGNTAVVQLLLSSAPATAAAGTGNGATPMHVAALHGHTAIVQLLLSAAPATATARTTEGRTPLSLAIHNNHTAAACPLLAHGPAAEVLSCLAAAGNAFLTLFADFIIVRPQLSDAEWAIVPTPCPGLGRALPAALEHSPAHAQQGVARLTPADQERLRTAPLCLARAQHQHTCHLPQLLVWRVLALSLSS